MDTEYLDKLKETHKKVFITLKNGRLFSGTVERVGLNSIIIIDKFNEEVSISRDSIQHIETDRKVDGRNGGYNVGEH